MRHRPFITRAIDHLRQEHLAAAEQVADHVHAIHQRPFDDLDRPVELLARLFGIGNDMRVDPLDQRMLEPASHLPAPPLLGRLLVGGALALVALGKVDQPLGRIGAAHEDDILAGFAQFGIDLVVDVELAGIDDRHVEPSRDGVIEEHRVHRAAHGFVAAKAEAEVRQAAAGLGVRTAGLDRDRLDEVEPVAIMLLDPVATADVGIEEISSGGKPIPVSRSYARLQISTLRSFVSAWPVSSKAMTTTAAP